MKVKEIRIDGFRSIIETNMNLNEMIGMISSSSVSKNDLIKALTFGFSLATETDNRNFLYLSNREKYSPLVDKNFHFEIIYDSFFEHEDIEVDYYYDLDWKNEDSIEIVNEVIKYKPLSSQRQTTLYERHYSNLKYKASRQRPCEYEVYLSDSSLMANNVLLHKDLYYEKVVNELFDMDFLYVGPSSYSFTNTKNKYLSNGTTFDCSLNDLSKNLYVIYSNYGELYDQIFYYINKIFPKVESINANKQVRTIKGFDPSYYVYIKYRGLDEPIGLDETPIEIKKILNLLILSAIATIKNTNLVLFDEIENSINPMMVVDCVESMAKILKETSAIFTTYSPVLLDGISIENIYIAVDEKTPVVKFKTIKPTYFKRVYERSTKLDMPLGYYLFSAIVNEEVFEDEILKNALV